MTPAVAALAQVRENPARFALGLTDQTMPEMTGLVLAAELRKVRAALPVILMTGDRSPLVPGRLETAGVRQLQPKPATLRPARPRCRRRSRPIQRVNPRAPIFRIDDDVRTLIRLALVDFGPAVNAARKGRAGLARFPHAAADLVIPDIVMPDGEGLEVVMALRRRVPPVQILAISGGRRGGPRGTPARDRRDRVGPGRGIAASVGMGGPELDGRVSRAAR